MHSEVVLRQADVTELVLGAPRAGQRGLLFIYGRVESPQTLAELFFLFAESRVSVNHDRHQKPTARRLPGHGDRTFSYLLKYNLQANGQLAHQASSDKKTSRAGPPANELNAATFACKLIKRKKTLYSL